VKEGSEWQNGPEVSQFPREQWPISREFVREIPENLISNCYAVVEAKLKMNAKMNAKFFNTPAARFMARR